MEDVESDSEFFDSPKQFLDKKNPIKNSNYLQDGGIEIPVEPEADTSRTVTTPPTRKIEARVPTSTLSSQQSRQTHSDTDSNDYEAERKNRSYRKYKESKARSRSTSRSRTEGATHQAWGDTTNGNKKSLQHSDRRSTSSSRDSSPRRINVDGSHDLGSLGSRKKRHRRRKSDSCSSDSSKSSYTGSSCSASKSQSGSESSSENSTSESHSDSDITDVSPIGSPDISPTLSTTRKHRDSTGPRQRGRTYSGDERSPRHKDMVQYTESGTMTNGINDPLLNSDKNDKVDLALLMQAVLEMDKDKTAQKGRRIIIVPPPGTENRKNFSFQNDKVRDIDRENERLLNQIMDKQSPKKRGRAVKKSPAPDFEKLRRITPAAVNRQREQRRIEMENMEILKRLKGVKPTKGMSKIEQVSDYRRQALLGVPTFTPPPNKTLSSPYGSTAALANRSQSMLSMRSTSTMQGGRSRPNSAKQRPSSAKETTRATMVGHGNVNVNMNRPVSAKSTGNSGQTRQRPSSGGQRGTVKQAWQWEAGW